MQTFNNSPTLWNPVGNRVLVVAPHPDDESLGCGGSLVKHCAHGDSIKVVFLTAGEKGDFDRRYGDEYVKQRRSDAVKALAKLGVSDCLFLDLPDQGLTAQREILERKLTSVLKEYLPTLIYAPSPWEPHHDHRTAFYAVYNLVREIVRPPVLALYEVGAPLIFPDVVVDVTTEMARKREAIASYRTEHHYQDYQTIIEALNIHRTYGLDRSVRHAEAFTLLSSEELAHPSEKTRRIMRTVEPSPQESAAPLVSIVVRTKDRPKMLREALESIANQSYRPIEVVLVNDGGADLPIDELHADMKGVDFSYHRLENSVGRVRAANIGWRAAKGRYIGFLDDDDQYYPDHVASLANLLEGSGHRIAYTDHEIVRIGYDPVQGRMLEQEKIPVRSIDFSLEHLLLNNYIPFMCLLFDQAVLVEAGGLDERFDTCEDWDLLARIGKRHPFIHLPKITARYTFWSRDHQTINQPERIARGRLQFYRTHRDEIDEHVLHKAFFTDELIWLPFLEKRLAAFIEENRGLQEQLTAGRSRSRRTMEEVEKSEMDLRSLLHESEQEIHVLRKHLAEIQQSLGWRILMYYRRRVGARIFPMGSRRRQLLNLMLRGLISLRRYGARNTLAKVRAVLSRSVAVKYRIRRERFVVPVIRSAEGGEIDTKVSVLLPTYNAGHDLHQVLQHIHAQQGIREIEVIVIDSGSDDGTRELAAEYGAKVHDIRKEEFNHGETRNLAASLASGEYLVFLSQDAIPVGQHSIYGLVSAMRTDAGIAAATSRQVPRSDADVFACWQLWYYTNKIMAIESDRVESCGRNGFFKLPSLERRRMAQIDNVFSCVRRDVFEQFRYRRLPYAEDLDLGIRLLDAGHKIAFLSSVSVVHSHVRPSAYFFKRSMVGIETLLDLLQEDPIAWDKLGMTSVDEMWRYANRFYRRLNGCIGRLRYWDHDETSTADRLAQVRNHLATADVPEVSLGEASLDAIFGSMSATPSAAIKHDVLLHQYLDNLQSLEEYLGQASLSGPRGDILPELLYKTFAAVAGANIGNFMVHAKRLGLETGDPHVGRIAVNV